MSDEVNRYRPTRALHLNGLDKLEKDSGVMSEFSATISHPRLSLKFQVHAFERCGMRDAGTTVRKILTATMDEERTLPCNELGTGGKMSVPIH